MNIVWGLVFGIWGFKAKMSVVKGGSILKLVINSKEIKARSGETVLEVCQREGIYVPTLCYQKDLEPYGGCRLCLVEVKGWARPVTACTLRAEDGMVVETDNAFLKTLRVFTLQLILSEHPHACLICERTEDCAKYQECIQKSAITFGCKFCSQNRQCELQKLVDYLEIKEIPFKFSYRNLAVERRDPFFDRDYNICILCGRCVRVCQEIRGAGVLDFQHRGPETSVGTAFDLPHIDTGCQFCGACVDACPTGALSQRYGKWEGEIEKSISSTCPLCSIGCAVKLNIVKNKVISATPDENQLCVRGRFGLVPLTYHPKRITAPLLKKDGRMSEVSWEEALQYLASKLSEHKGKTSIVFSPQLTVEAIDLVGSLAANLTCANVATTVPLAKSLMPMKIEKIEDAVCLVVNTDMISDFSPLLLRLKSNKNVKLVAIDALQSKITDVADLWLRPKLGYENEALKIIFSAKNIPNKTGIAALDIKWAKDLLKGRNSFLVYNPGNLASSIEPDSVKVLTLTSQINNQRIIELGIDYSLPEMLGKEDIDCLYLIGARPKLARKYRTIIVQDCFLPDFDFDLFLPAATSVETEGTVIDIEGKEKKLRKAIEPIGKSKPDDWILSETARILNYDMKGNKRDRKNTIPEIVNANVKTTNKFPIYLLVRENCYLYRSTPLSSLIKGFARIRNDSAIWLNDVLARKLKIEDGMEVKITGQDLFLEIKAMVSDRVPEGAALIYWHPGLGNISNQAVRIEKHGN